jgi:hypothetical protein
MRLITHDDEAPPEGATGHVGFGLAHALLIDGDAPEAPVVPWPADAARVEERLR